MNDMETNLDRRDFIKGAALVGASALSVGALAVSSSDEAVAAPVVETTSSTASWRIKPDPIPDSEITKEYSAEVIVVGHGYAGITSCREIAESGHSVILIDLQPEDGYMAMGNSGAAINMPFLMERGVPYIDPIEFFNNWQINTQNTSNPILIMKWVKNSADTMTWYHDGCSQEQYDAISVSYFTAPADRSKQLSEIFPYKFWAGSCDTGGPVINQTMLQTYNREAAMQSGAEFHFSTKAKQLVQDASGKVTGLIATDANGNYVKYNGIVMLGTGGFGMNPEMMYDLLPDLAECLTEGEELRCLRDSDGSGIQMAYWAGGRLEPTPIPTMDGRIPWVGEEPAHYESIGHPQGLWLDKNGNRFCNEFWGPIEYRTRPGTYMNRSQFFCIYDGNWPENLKYFVPSHGAQDPTDEFFSKLGPVLEQALEAGPNGPVEGNIRGGTGYSSLIVYGGNTLEELLDNMGVTDQKLRANILASIDRWNELCEKGVDEDFGRQPNLLFPIKDGPFYGQASSLNKIGGMLCTLGGILTDGEQRVVDKDWNPIPGLYASGNTTGRRFGSDYFTPIYGVSLGIAITLGREAGRSIVRELEQA